MIEFLLMFLLLVGILGGFAQYMVAAHARSALIQAVDAAGRSMASACDPYSGTPYPVAQADARLAFLAVLTREGLEDPLRPAQQPAVPGVRRSYTLDASCGAGVATVSTTYEATAVFPVLGRVLLAGGDNTAGTIQLKAGAQFPVE